MLAQTDGREELAQLPLKALKQKQVDVHLALAVRRIHTQVQDGLIARRYLFAAGVAGTLKAQYGKRVLARLEHTARTALVFNLVFPAELLIQNVVVHNDCPP